LATYYLFSPNLNVTAEVDAPTTRSARTAFLDYLTRTGKLPFSQRRVFRKKLITKRMQPGEIRTTVQLVYGESQPPVRVFQPTEESIVSTEDQNLTGDTPRGLPVEAYLTWETPRKIEKVEVEKVPATEGRIEPVSSREHSPIMNLSKQRGGF